MSLLRLRITFVGMAKLLRRLEFVKVHLARRVMRKAIQAAGSVYWKAIRSFTPKYKDATPSNTLIKSIGVGKVKTYRTSGNTILMAGPRRNMTKTTNTKPNAVYREIQGRTVKIPLRSVAKRPSLMVKNNTPTRIGHLAEDGAWRGGGGNHKPRKAYRYMKRGARAAKAAAMAAFSAVMRSELHKLGV